MIHLPGYELHEQIHESQRTLVFRAKRLRDRAAVVVKLPASSNPSALALIRFRHEFELGSLVRKDSHVITYYSLESYSGGLALIVEDFGAQPLGQLLPKHGLDLSAFLHIAIQVAKGLQEIHRAEIVHKDINPSNLVMNPKTMVVKFIDFDISSQLQSEFRSLETLAKLEGTLAYISPEQTGRMNRTLDYRTDFYSLGITFYHLLSGILPFSGEDALKLIHCHIAKQAQPVHLLRPDIPETVSAILDKLMAKDAEKRYQSSSGLLADLEKCHLAVAQGQPVVDFQPGKNDVSNHFFLSQKFYGREQERDTLLKDFEAVIRGEMRCLMISGSAGIGKSTLIKELYKPTAAARAFMISGQFDPLKRDVPYSALSNAFGDLVNRIMVNPDHVVQVWRERILRAVGINGRAIQDALPGLDLLLGHCAPVEKLDPEETRNRFYRVFRACLEVLATESHPLVLVLDDMQWADSASLSLFERLLREREQSFMMLICAYRHTEVDERHPLQLTLNNLIRAGKPTPRLQLSSLNVDQLTNLIADSLHCTLQEATPLAAIVSSKTDGNPFFCNQWLKTLHHRRFLRFDHSNGRWQWDAERIAELEVSSNVVDFLISNLNEMPPATVSVLRAAACLGNRFDLDALAATWQREKVTTARHLWPALRYGLVVPLSRSYHLLDPTWAEESALDVNVSYRFQHDRVKQASYALLSEKEALAFHLQIGRRLIQAHKEGGSVPVMEALAHLNRSRHLLQDKDERHELALLNLEAGRKALTSVAYKMAHDYLNIALECMDQNMWEEQYALAYQIHYYRCQTAFFQANPQRAETLCDELLLAAQTPEEKAQVLGVRMAQLTTKGQMGRAIEVGIAGLALLGFQLPAQIKPYQLRLAFLKVSRLLAKQDISTLHDRPDLTNERIRAALNILMRIAFPAYLSANRNLHTMVALMRVRLCLEFGNSPEAATAYATYGLLLGATRGDFKAGETFGQLALKLDERYRSIPLRCKVLYTYGLTIYPWSHHWRGISTYLKEVVATGYQSGDFLIASMAASQVYQWDPTLDLETAQAESRKYLAMVKDMGHLEIELQAQVFQQVRFNLMGRTLSRLSLSDAHFDESLLKLENFQGTTMATSYHILRLQLFYLHGEFNQAEKEAEQALPALATVLGLPISVEYTFYRFLNLAALARQVDSRERRDYQARMRPLYRNMCGWATHCPTNFEHRRILMEAESTALKGQESHALDLYQQAIDAAREHRYQALQALSAELAGSFLAWRGRPKLASVYLCEAIDIYRRWGALGKVKQMLSQHPELATKAKNHILLPEQSTAPASLSSISEQEGSAIDLASVIKSSMAISQQIEYRSLVSSMMDIIIEAAGARKGVLVRLHNSQLRVEAVTDLNAPCHEVIRAEMLDESHDLSGRAVRFSLNTGQVLLLPHACEDHHFSRDPYIKENSVKSLLCLPIRHKDHINGVLYLENNLSEGVFTVDRLDLLQLLVTQAAISLENARLLSEARRTGGEVRKLNRDLAALNEQLEQKVRDRTIELKDVHEELLERAHQAGMAEIATTVLHNVGNILNSVITSCQLIHSTAENTRVGGLLKANAMLRVNMDRLVEFVANDPKGRGLMEYYLGLDKPFLKERSILMENSERLLEKVASIRDVIMAQQSYASKGYQNEAVSLADVIGDALNMLMSTVKSNAILVEQEFAQLPNLFLPRTKLIRLFVNLIKNAVDAMKQNQGKRCLHIATVVESPLLKVIFKDTGQGISPEHLDHIFQHGYTTKNQGHGFGLHSAANSMTEMDGTISVSSELGKGATFTLSFPFDSGADTYTSSPP